MTQLGSLLLTDGDKLDQPTFAHLQRLRRKIEECGQAAWLCEEEVTGQAHVTICRCKSRLCPTCGRRRSQRVESKVRQYAQAMDSRRLLTLTLAHSQTPLREQISKLTKSFRKLRNSKLFKTRCTGGIYTIEVTYRPADDRWHPHLHAIIDGDFIEVSAIRAAWKKATGDSYIVDIRQIYSASALAKYVAKYVAKSQNPESLPDHRLVEWCIEVHSLRLVNTFGKLHGLKLDTRKELNRPKLVRICTLNQIAWAARNGDQDAERLAMMVTTLVAADPSQHYKDLAAEARKWWLKKISARDGPEALGPEPPEAQPSELFWTDTFRPRENQTPMQAGR